MRLVAIARVLLLVVTWVNADDPPTLLQFGGLDCTVPFHQSERLRDALRAVIDSSRVP